MAAGLPHFRDAAWYYTKVLEFQELFWFYNPFNSKLTMQILPTIQEENDRVM